MPARRCRRRTAGPIRKDEIELDERGVYIESWLPERRSRRKPLLFVHGELGGSWVWERYLGYFAARGWEGHALNLRNHYWSQTADPADTFLRYLHGGRRRQPRAVRLGRRRHRPRDGRTAGAQGGGADGHRRPRPDQLRACRASCGSRSRQHELREIPDVYGKSLIGWETLPERLLRDERDLTLADVLRDPAPARPEAARSGCGATSDAGRRAGRSTGRGRHPAPGHRCRPGPGRVPR